MIVDDGLLPTLESLARRAAEAEGLDLGWIELKRQGGTLVLRVFIDRPDENVGLKDCERVSARLGLLLDVEDPIESSYTLEISTPGLDRPLHDAKDYERFSGRAARVRTREPFQGRRRLAGRIGGVRDGNVLLEENELGPVAIPFATIEGARLEVELPELGEKTRPRQNRSGGHSRGSQSKGQGQGHGQGKKRKRA